MSEFTNEKTRLILDVTQESAPQRITLISQFTLGPFNNSIFLTNIIFSHLNAYSNPNLTTWAQANYTLPRNSLYDGC